MTDDGLEYSNECWWLIVNGRNYNIYFGSFLIAV